MEIKIEFAGGLEHLLKEEARSISVAFSAPSSQVRLFHVVSFVARRLLCGKPELFAAPYTPEDPEVYAQLQRHQKEAAAGEATSDSDDEQSEDGKKVYSTLDLLQGCMAVRGGVLALVNEIDCEVLEGQQTPISSSDTVTFISTLHGG